VIFYCGSAFSTFAASLPRLRRERMVIVGVRFFCGTTNNISPLGSRTGRVGLVLASGLAASTAALLLRRRFEER
jgi:hypothetical protein